MPIPRSLVLDVVVVIAVVEAMTTRSFAVTETEPAAEVVVTLPPSIYAIALPDIMFDDSVPDMADAEALWNAAAAAVALLSICAFRLAALIASTVTPAELVIVLSTIRAVAFASSVGPMSVPIKASIV